MIKYKILILFLLFIDNLVFACKFTDTSINQVYDFTSIVKTVNEYYNATFTSNSYSILFNLCSVGVKKCNQDGTNIACQIYNETPEIISSIIAVSSNQPNVSFNSNRMTLVYRSNQLSTDNYCSKATEPYRRILVLDIVCNPKVEFNLLGTNIEESLCRYKIPIESKYVCKSCQINGCSGHGTCSSNFSCLCDSQTTGEFCEKSRIYISSIDPPPESGGFATLYGYFGNITSKFKLYIGGILCGNFINYNTDILKCQVGPGSGYRNVSIIDGDLTYFAKDLFYYQNNSTDLLKCPNNCTGNGICQSGGSCECFHGYNSFDCSIFINETFAQVPIPNVNSTTGESTIRGINETTGYQISIYSLVEYNQLNGSIVYEHLLNNLTNLKPSSLIIDGSNRILKFTQFLSIVSCTVEYTLEEVLQVKKEFNFSGITFSSDPGSIKLSISIKNYKYSSTLNTLQLRIKSTAIDNMVYCDGDNNDNSSPESNIEVNSNYLKDNNNNFSYLTIKKDSTILVSAFLNRLLSDGRIAPTTTSIISNQSNEILIGLDMPHCQEECILDPSYSVLIQKSVNSNNNNKQCNINNKSNSREKWFLPVVIVSSCIGLALIIIFGSIIYRRNRVHFKVIKKNIIKLRNI